MSPSAFHRRQISRNAFVPASLVLLLLAWWAARGIDAQWARQLLAWEGGQWSLKQHALLETVMHRGGRALSLLAWTGILIAVAVRWPRENDRRWTRPAVRLLIATLVSAMLVGWLKSVTHMDCPWDIAGFGGQRPLVPLFAARPETLGKAACFPAAHAAAGYAWVALYFFLAAVRPRWRWAGLATGLLAGAAFGFAQQLRGAHFLSHDIASLAICWTVACTVEGAWQWHSRQAGRERAA